MIGPSIWHLVEHSAKDGQEATLMRTSRHGRDVYALKINGSFDNYYYNSNDAFNALERWEVKQGLAPKDYKPEVI
jgi:hypothetical protein